jgi:uncharacterized protein (DUF885 family)
MKRKHVILAVLFLFLCPILAGCGDIAPTRAPVPATSPTGTINEPDQQAFDRFLDDAFFAQLRRDPQLVSSLGLSSAFGMGNDQLTDVSDAYELETYAMLQSQLEGLHKFDRRTLTSDRQFSYDLFEWDLEDRLEGQEFRFHTFPVRGALGLHTSLVEFMTDRHSIKSRQDAEDYVSRLEQFSTKFEQLIEWLEIQEGEGIVPPRSMAQRVLSQLDSFLAQAPGEMALYTSFEAKVSAASSISTRSKTQLYEQALRAIETSVIPAFRSLRTHFEHVEAIAGTDDGLWNQPSGDAAYAYWLRHHTTTDLSAEQIHQLGLQEVIRIEAEMESLLAELGITADTMADKMEQVALQGGVVAPDKIVEEYETLLARIERFLPDYFDIRPRAGVVVVPFEDPSAPGGYHVMPAVDGSRPGMFYANLASRGGTRYLMPTLAYHEAIPGHHFQQAIQFELTGIPAFRNGLNPTAYSEGWALYAERLAWELGVYADDPYGDLGRLQGELLRAARLVVDTGIHAKRWTREQAIGYMVKTVGDPEVEMTAEVERYIVLPGQATAYKIGMLKILELRERAREALGDAFSIEEFHNTVLQNGGMPLHYLEQVVDNYVREELNQ